LQRCLLEEENLIDWEDFFEQFVQISEGDMAAMTRIYERVKEKVCRHLGETLPFPIDIKSSSSSCCTM
jgi:hypothetical protein